MYRVKTYWRGVQDETLGPFVSLSEAEDAAERARQEPGVEAEVIESD